MGELIALITEKLGPLGPVFVVACLGVLLIALTLPALIKNDEDPLTKLRKSRENYTKRDQKVDLRRSSGSDKLEKYSAFLEPKDEKEYSAIQLKLLQAGYPGKSAVRTYHFAQLALGIVMLIFGLAMLAIKTANGQELGLEMRIAWVFVPAACGYLFPKYWVTRRVETRREEIINGFPDSLDMMLVCVEAGQSLDQSILRVSKEMNASYPAIAEEFTTVSDELKAGKDRTHVLRDLAERAGVPDVSSFVTVMIQSANFGTSIAEALRVYAAEMRDKRVMRAEEKANKLPTKMTLATMLFTLPPLLVILLGPSIYSIVQTLTNPEFF